MCSGDALFAASQNDRSRYYQEMAALQKNFVGCDLPAADLIAATLSPGQSELKSIWQPEIVWRVHVASFCLTLTTIWKLAGWQGSTGHVFSRMGVLSLPLGMAACALQLLWSISMLRVCLFPATCADNPVSPLRAILHQCCKRTSAEDAGRSRCSPGCSQLMDVLCSQQCGSHLEIISFAQAIVVGKCRIVMGKMLALMGPGKTRSLALALLIQMSFPPKAGRWPSGPERKHAWPVPFMALRCAGSLSSMCNCLDVQCRFQQV